MTDGPGLNLADLRRQLSDLAESMESEQPWDDPLPHVLRAARTADLGSEPHPKPGPYAVARGHLAKINWPRFNPVPIVSVAAAFLAIALIGVLVHGGGDGSKKSASASTQGFHSYGSAAAAAGGARTESRSSAGTGGPDVTRRPAPAPRVAGCGTLPTSSRLALKAPAETVRGGVIRVRVSTSAGVRLTSPTILVQAGSEVVGRLVPTVATPEPTSSGSASSFAVTGRLVRTALSCGDLPRNTTPGPAGQPASALPAGHYRLVVTGSTGTGRAASAPVAITIHQ